MAEGAMNQAGAPGAPVAESTIPSVTSTKLSQFVNLLAGGGISVLIAWIAFSNLSKEVKDNQTWMRAEFITEIKKNTEANAIVAGKLGEVAKAIEEGKESDADTRATIEDLRRSTDQLTLKLSEMIPERGPGLREQLRENSDAPSH